MRQLKLIDKGQMVEREPEDKAVKWLPQKTITQDCNPGHPLLLKNGSRW